MNQSSYPVRRRRWPIFLPLALVAVLAALWTAGWFYAASKAEAVMTEWRAREARLGRIYECGTQAISGFPFRFEVRCDDPNAHIGNLSPPVGIKAKQLLAVAQIYQPTLLIGEFTGPLSVGEAAQSPSFVANWTLAQASVRGLPSPERVSLVVDSPTVDRAGTGATRILRADKIELHGRKTTESTPENLVLDLAIRLAAASAPDLHAATVQPLDADVTAVLRGLPDIAPKPWITRLKELQARGGRLDISAARVQQGDVIVVGAGNLGLTARGGLDGQLRLTVVNLDKLLTVLGIDRALSQGRTGAALDRLDRLMPGLGNLARQNPGGSVVAGLGMLGQTATLEGKPAVTLPLRFADGAAFLGPLPVGRVPPLF